MYKKNSYDIENDIIDFEDHIRFKLINKVNKILLDSLAVAGMIIPTMSADNLALAYDLNAAPAAARFSTLG
jgi:hypothetical protein